MSGFDPDWLALREPFDRAAREAAAHALDIQAFAAGLRHRRGPDAALEVLDLGCGTGANLRALAPQLGGTQRWRLVDHDPQLLAVLPGALQGWAASLGWHAERTGTGLRIEAPRLRLDIVWQQADLAADLEGLRLDDADLVTASALLDLVSADWLARWIARSRAAGAALCFALSVDDRLRWQPSDAADDEVHALFRAHQRRDKGFGPALGGAAVDAARPLLARAGYRCTTAASDWHVDAAREPAHRAMLAAMVDGIASAASEQDPAAAGRVRAWRDRRHALLAGPSAMGLVVGHTELLAWFD
jgi:SAM-dependent methyltransferase